MNITDQHFPEPTYATRRGLALRANFQWTLVGNVVYAGCQWGMLVVLAKLGTPDTVGRFALGLAVTAPVFMFASLQLRGVQATDAQREYSFGDYLGLRLIMTGLALLVIAGIALGSGYRRDIAVVILILGLAKAVESISDVFYGLFQQHERMDGVAISMMVRGALSLAALSLAVYWTDSLAWGAAGLAATWIATLAIIDVRNGAKVLSSAKGLTSAAIASRIEWLKTLRPCLSQVVLCKLLWLTLPLGVVMLLVSLNTNIPRYFIAHYLGDRDLGIFAAMAYLMIAGTTVVSALGQSASPRLSQYYASGDYAAFRSLLLKLSCLGLIVGGAGVLVTLLAGRRILTFLYSAEYAQHAGAFVWLMIATGVSYVASLLGYGMTAAHYFRTQTLLFLLTSVVTIIACALLIPAYHLPGAALSLVIAMGCQLIGSLLVIAHALRRSPLKNSTLIQRQPRRILHLVGSMNRGGVETWLMSVLRNIDRSRVHMDFLVHTTKPGDYDEEIRALGSNVIPCLSPYRPWQYARNLKRILHDHGPYDAVHSHVHHYSGYVLRVAAQAGVPMRIAHSHSDTARLRGQDRLVRRTYLKLMHRFIGQHATNLLACSRNAAAALFGQSWEDDHRCRVLHYGIELHSYKAAMDRRAIRAELNLPADAFVIGHVGRFADVKNHEFLIDVAAEVMKREPSAYLLLVGEGPLRSVIEQRVARAGIGQRVVFTGLRRDVPRLLAGAMDAFLFPSHYEGLGLVLVEAQAAGLVCIFSDVVPEEADVVRPLLRRLSLSQPISDWAKSLLEQRNIDSTIKQTDALAMIEKSAFNIQTSVSELRSIYHV
jgi:O-antigen/teichoic acid export membrane protein/glycosyltransferase involved in cell wall biosynthesis